MAPESVTRVTKWGAAEQQEGPPGVPQCIPACTGEHAHGVRPHNPQRMCSAVLLSRPHVAAVILTALHFAFHVVGLEHGHEEHGLGNSTLAGNATLAAAGNALALGQGGNATEAVLRAFL